MPVGYRQFAPHDQLPSTFPNALSSFLSGAVLGFQVVIKPGAPTVLQVPASSENPAAITIGGKWRYVTAPVERASPGGVAQTFDVYATAADNDFGTASDDVGPYEVDNTDYSFALALVASGGAAPSAALTRKVATVLWSGSQFIAVAPIVAAAPARQIIYPGDYKHSLQTADHGTNPAGGYDWLLWQDGRALSAATYPGLWAAMGSPTLDANGNFTLPARAGRALVAAGAGAGLTSRARGQTFGVENVTLTAAQSGVNGNGSAAAVTRSHSHSPNAQSQSGFVLVSTTATAQFTYGGTGTNQSALRSTTVTTTDTWTHGHTLTARQADQAHTNLGPSAVENLFVKT